MAADRLTGKLSGRPLVRSTPVALCLGVVIFAGHCGGRQLRRRPLVGPSIRKSWPAPTSRLTSDEAVSEDSSRRRFGRKNFSPLFAAKSSDGRLATTPPDSATFQLAPTCRPRQWASSQDGRPPARGRTTNGPANECPTQWTGPVRPSGLWRLAFRSAPALGGGAKVASVGQRSPGGSH